MTLKSPHVSIITLTYNHEKYIEECIKSVLHQTFDDWELVIINDGSTDATLEICEHYATKDQRIKVYSQNNVGLEKIGLTYNFALGKSTGKYVAVLEGDDFWAPKKLEVYLKKMEADNSVLGYGCAYLINSMGAIIDCIPTKRIIAKKEIMTNNPQGMFYKLYLRKSFIPSATLTFKRDELTRIGGFHQGEGMKVVDYATVLSMVPVEIFSFITEPLAYYRIYSEQATSSGNMDTGCSTKYALKYFKSLPKEEQEFINISIRYFEKQIKRKKAIRSFDLGRKNLVWKKKRDALKFFLSMLKCPHPTIILRSLLGLICLFLNLDLERLVSAFGFRRLG